MNGFSIMLLSSVVFIIAAGALLYFVLVDERRAATAKRLQSLQAPDGAAAELQTITLTPNQQGGGVLDFLPKRMRDQIDAEIRATGDSLDPRSLLISGAIAGLVTLLAAMMLLRLPLLIALPVALAVALVVPAGLLVIARARYDRKFLNLFPDGIDLIVRAIRAGLPISSALDSVGKEVPDPVGVEFRRILADMRIGLDLDESLKRAAGRVRCLEFNFFMASLILQRETGGNLSETLATLAGVLRRRKEMRLKAAAMTSEARASGMFLAALPFFAAGALLLINPSYLNVFVTDPRGKYLLGVAAMSLLTGVLTMRWMIKRALR